LFLQWIPRQFELADYVIEIEPLLAPLLDQDDLDEDEDPDAMSQRKSNQKKCKCSLYGCCCLKYRLMLSLKASDLMFYTIIYQYNRCIN
jgi:hypothetical protein